ncbi:MAG: hypothetical protein B6I24_09230 [Bacteroidetes bacterium 4572_128]|nr:MAG: hypothetical protein B6I24_09230 [Bacteroidetes bacterium 4572_128]
MAFFEKNFFINLKTLKFWRFIEKIFFNNLKIIKFWCFLEKFFFKKNIKILPFFEKKFFLIIH